MNTKDFENVLKEALADIEGTLNVKAGQYQNGEDRLSNFKRAAATLQQSPQRALIGMLAKHDVCLLDMVENLEKGRLFPLSRWREVLIDSINYRILLLAMMSELFENLKKAQDAKVEDEAEKKDLDTEPADKL